ncbi:putative disease resistance RPP13-like protein 1 [Ziziphus jujuba]|uniref:Disease resistance RPP13-like protein 1 n=1 Tax=Ziziphus jujuba TaxID=326968 RepID=A0A6P3Z3I6_ZIZJJ|nr:putative disease resistance RPP13-like protein 1 [Ziziphus jujuba]
MLVPMASALLPMSCLKALESVELVDFIEDKNAMKEQLQKLKSVLLSYSTLLNDAVKKQIGDADVDMWISDVEDVCYDVQDLLDEIETEALRCKVAPESEEFSRINQVVNLMSTPFNVEKVCQDILEVIAKLESLLKLKDGLDLKEFEFKFDYDDVQPPKSLLTPATASASEYEKKLLEKSGVNKKFPPLNIVEYDVYGRDYEKESIVKLLLSDYNNMSVIPICGMAGIGKTTLARMIYEDVEVNKHFDLKAWVCVSDEFDLLRLTTCIFESVTSIACEFKDVNFLQFKLKESLVGKKFLFVLDDVWDKNYVHWDFFKSSFESGAKGSKIILTTQNEVIATMIGNVPTFDLKTISAEDGLKLLNQHAFDNSESGLFLDLSVIGQEIVKKCNGFPLAVKTLAGLLRFHSQQETWDNILNSNLWELSKEENSILPALWFSYQYLPPHLKQCFAYCSVFPKGYEIDKEQLILMWMAQDLLQPEMGQSIEEVGERCLNDLISRSLLQHSRACQSAVTMHDLVHDLAKSISREFCFKLYDYISLAVVSKMQARNFGFQKLKTLSKAKIFHAFLEAQWRKVNTGLPLHRLVYHELLPRLPHLRLLSLPSCPILELPHSVCELKHLKYLDLSSTLLKELPSTICSLSKLQTLLLSNCRNLTRLPTNITSLSQLRHLDITNTCLAEMPLQMSRMRNLQSLSDFVVGKYSGSGIEELKELQHLHGTLRISGLQNVGDVGKVIQANLKDKQYLCELGLRWRGDTDDSLKEREVLDSLRPHTKLKKLIVKFYGGTRFPDWIGDGSYSNMVSMHLKDCKNCYILPPLGELPSLRYLEIIGFDSVMRIGPEFYYNSSSMTKPFRRLEILRICSMLEWQEWFLISDKDDGGFPHLKELYLEDCPKLCGSLPYCLPSLKLLQISGCQQMVTLLPKELQMGTVYPSLQTMEIYYCRKLETLPEGQWPSNLHSLTVSYCRNLRAPNGNGFQHLTSLKNLHISCCHELMCLPEKSC